MWIAVTMSTSRLSHTMAYAWREMRLDSVSGITCSKDHLHVARLSNCHFFLFLSSFAFLLLHHAWYTWIGNSSLILNPACGARRLLNRNESLADVENVVSRLCSTCSLPFCCFIRKAFHVSLAEATLGSNFFKWPFKNWARSLFGMLKR